MNRILFEPSECQVDAASAASPLQVSLPPADPRAVHILTVLHGTPGMPLKVGIVNGPIGTGVITAIPQSPLLRGCADSGRQANLTIAYDLLQAAPSPEPWFDLVLAPPRPRAMKRLLPQLATLGLRHLYLVGAEKVEKDFWGATLLQEAHYRPLFIEGLQQAGTSILPTLSCHRSFRRFLREHPGFDGTRLVAHPYTASHQAPGTPHQASFFTFAVGPEGGWTDEEVALLEADGFIRYSLGSRILRTDTALIALISRFLPS